MTAVRCSPIERLCATLAFVCDERHTRVMDAAARHGLTPTEFGYIQRDGRYRPVWGRLDPCPHLGARARNLDAYTPTAYRAWVFGDVFVEERGAAPTVEVAPDLYLVSYRRDFFHERAARMGGDWQADDLRAAMEDARYRLDTLIDRNRAALL